MIRGNVSIGWFNRAPALFAALAASIGCNSNANAPDASVTCAPQTASDGGIFYQCLGGTWPLCANSPGLSEPSGACNDGSAPCMGCSDGVGFGCSCQVDQEGGLAWLCVGTEYTCR